MRFYYLLTFRDGHKASILMTCLAWLTSWWARQTFISDARHEMRWGTPRVRCEASEWDTSTNVARWAPQCTGLTLSGLPHVTYIYILPGMKCMHFICYIKQRHFLKLHAITNCIAFHHQRHHITHCLSNSTVLQKSIATEWQYVTNGCCISVGHYVTKWRYCQRVPRH